MLFVPSGEQHPWRSVDHPSLPSHAEDLGCLAGRKDEGEGLPFILSSCALLCILHEGLMESLSDTGEQKPLWKAGDGQTDSRHPTPSLQGAVALEQNTGIALRLHPSLAIWQVS